MLQWLCLGGIINKNHICYQLERENFMFEVIKVAIHNHHLSGSLNDSYDSVLNWIKSEKELMSISDFEYEYLNEILNELITK